MRHILYPKQHFLQEVLLFTSQANFIYLRRNIFRYTREHMEQSKTKKIMWTEITITIFWTNDANQDIENVFNIFYDLEKEFSRFTSESSLSILNKKRTGEVSATFIDVLNKCKEIYSDTNFYFNPLINVRQLGYSKDFHSKQFKKEDTELQVNLELEKIEITWNRVKLQEGQNLDLGGIVKWYGVDKAKEYLHTRGYKRYIIDAGGDIYTSGSNESWGKIVVGIDSPYVKGNIFATIDVENIAIATSGNYKRKWTIADEEYNHIINPITSGNNNEIISITLIGDACYLIDAYATACIAMGLEKTLEFLKKNYVEGVIMCTNKKVYTTQWMKEYTLKII